MKLNKKIINLILLFVVIVSCDEGLKPPDKSGKSYIAFNFFYVGGVEKWPDSTEMKAMRFVAFKSYPPKDILQDVIDGEAYFTFLSLPLYVESSSKLIEIPDTPQKLEYLVAAWQYMDSLSAQKVAGVYTESGDNTKPSSIFLDKGDTAIIDIFIDFENLPPQPF